MARATSSFDFESWFIDFSFSASAQQTLRRMCRQIGLQPADTEDASQHWVEKVLRTLRKSGTPEWVLDDETARMYALRAARNAAVDVGCRGQRKHETVIGPVEAPSEALELLLDADKVGLVTTVADQVVALEWCESARAHISGRFYARDIACENCPIAQVVAIAVHIVNTACESGDDHGALERWVAEIKGGTSEFGQLFYQAMSQVVPERMVVDPDGRIAPRSRKYKSRCEPCVIDVLVDLLDHTGEAGATRRPIASDEMGA